MGGGDAGAAANDGGDSIENDGSKGGEVMVNIRCSNGSKFSVHVSLDSTVESFNSILAQNCEIPPQQQRLIYKGRILKDDHTLQSYGLEADHTVHLVRGFATNASTNSIGATNAGSPHTDPAVTEDAGSNEGVAFGGSGFGASLFPGLGLNGLGSGGGLFGNGLPDMEHVQAQLTQNPNMMRDILNMPLVQNIMNNPETIRNLIMNNPQMHEIMDRNPELAHILNDPATLRQTMEAAQNPELMREMMRNTDRAMSNIESSPEGFNMLRRMYENVQEPFLNATTLEGDTRTDLGSNPFAALLGAQGGRLAREQVTNVTTAGSETMTDSPAPNTNPLPNPWASTGTGDFSQLLGSMPDPNFQNQLMQNPAISQMMQSLLSNPQYINQIIGFNPELRNMFDSNPQFRDMMQNPEFIRQLLSPGMMQQLLTFQQAIDHQQTSREPGQNGGETGALDNLRLDMLMNMFGGLGTGGLTAPNRSNGYCSLCGQPEELYATQLSQLQEMGFFDTQENIRALIASAGNVHAAVEQLLGNPGR
ncbi:Ubiquitin domain-containing protein DSK2b [Forsythia ovata]|uniref:Ubiquitin domain-containing protein DSK2b n=1 Tax=Forsythia ovata TaxID=205694 RepID=A0ABD1WNF2_9LAMI